MLDRGATDVHKPGASKGAQSGRQTGGQQQRGTQEKTWKRNQEKSKGARNRRTTLGDTRGKPGAPPKEEPRPQDFNLRRESRTTGAAFLGARFMPWKKSARVFWGSSWANIARPLPYTAVDSRRSALTTFVRTCKEPIIEVVRETDMRLLKRHLVIP